MTACESCLRRAALLARLAPNIEKVATGQAGSRSQELLALGDADLAKAVGGSLRGLELPAAEGSVCRHRDAYPSALGHLGGSAPYALWTSGDPAILERLEGEPAVTIVGSRRATGYGRAVAHELGMLLAGAGVPVISGMAFGIDSAAHRGALDAAGPTIAVLGSGADTPTPVGASGVYRRTVERGLVISEMPNGFRPFRWSFPARNRIMAALGTVTVVVEAAERSGSLITVRIAQGLGREVGAVPGPINSRFSRGSNLLLADGAFPVLGAESVLDELFGPGRHPAETAPELDETLAAVLTAVEAGDTTPDAIARETRLGAGDVSAALARLELLGHLSADPTGRFTPVRSGRVGQRLT